MSAPTTNLPSGIPDETPERSDASPPKRTTKRVGRYAGANLRESPSSNPSPPTTKSLTTSSANPTSSHGRPIRRFSAVPHSLLTDPQLQSDMKALPSNYSFELAKTIHRLREANSTRVALQMPEGLLLYATTLSDILMRHTHVTSTVILADVTYGACCVDDLSAAALTCDFLVHYGHSCLIPISNTCIPTLYVFVHISFETSHLCKTLLTNFQPSDRIALVATIQFVDTAHHVRDVLQDRLPNLFVPQKRPLSPGELLGCTSPRISDADVMVYVGDGRFHLESAMISNPGLRALRYDPYAKRLTEERYSTEQMHAVRQRAIATAATARNFGIVLGTLGRQGSPSILKRLMEGLRQAGKAFVVVLLSELTVSKLQTLEAGGISAWVQIACPRLSIDWGETFSSTPLLTPYECFVALGSVQWREVYPMDYYAKDGGQWSNYYKDDLQGRRVQSKLPVQMAPSVLEKVG